MDLTAAINPVVQAGHAPRMTADSAGTLSAGFAERLADAQRTEDEAHDAARQLVGMSLILPLLKQARNDPFKSDLFHGGRGEEAFGGQWDQMIADRLAGRGAGGLVDALAARFAVGGASHG